MGTMCTVEKIVFERDNVQVIQVGDKFFERIFEGGETFESGDFNTMENAKFKLGIMPTIEENNKLIAEFMGYSQPHPDYPTSTYWYKEGSSPMAVLLFDVNWDWLMEVVEKINNTGRFEVVIQKGLCYVSDESNELTLSCPASNTLEAVYQAIVEFIKWYNND